MPYTSSWAGLFRPSRLLPWCYAALLLLLCALLVWRPLSGYNAFWVHAAVGRWICEHGEIPTHTLFLWTASEPWVYHHWLSEVTFYGLTCIAAEDALPYVVLAFTFAMVALSFLPAWNLWARRGRISAWTILPFYLVLDLASPRFQPRPELFTIVFLAILLRLLVSWSEGAPWKLGTRDVWLAGACIPLFTAWANFHGMVTVGLLLLGVTAACDLVQDRWQRRAWALVLVTALAFLAAMVNPYGFDYWYAFRPMASETFAHIQEWQPLWRITPFPLGLVVKEVVLAALALTAWALNPSRRLSQLGWLVVTCGMFAFAVRNSWLLGLVCLMVAAANVNQLDAEKWWQALGRRFTRRADASVPAPPVYLRWLVRAGLAVCLVMQILVLFGETDFTGPLLPENLEAGVVRFVQTQQPPGRVFNDYENASYLQWRFGGQPALYMDLLDAYPDRVTLDYFAVMTLTESGQALLSGEGLDWVILTTNRPGSSVAPLADYLDMSPAWMRVYAGRDGVIWVRRKLEAEARWRLLARSVERTNFRRLEVFNGKPIQ